MVLGMFAKIKERTSVVSHATSPSWASLATLAAALRLLRPLRLAHTPPCACQEILYLPISPSWQEILEDDDAFVCVLIDEVESLTVRRARPAPRPNP